MVHASIRPKFKVKRVGKTDEIRCKHKGCKAGWSYPVDTEMKPGAILHLLNHAASHDPGPAEPEAEE